MIFLTQILTFLFRPEVLAIIGVSTAIAIVYNKGKRSGKQSIQDQIELDKQSLLERLSKTSEINKKIEREINEKIDASYDFTIDQLIAKFLRLKINGKRRDKSRDSTDSETD